MGNNNKNRIKNMHSSLSPDFTSGFIVEKRKTFESHKNMAMNMLPFCVQKFVAVKWPKCVAKISNTSRANPFLLFIKSKPIWPYPKELKFDAVKYFFL